MIGRSLVEGGTGGVSIEMFNPLEVDVLLKKNTHSALVHPVEVKKEEGETSVIKAKEAARKISTKATLPEELQRMSEDIQFNLDGRRIRRYFSKNQLCNNSNDGYPINSEIMSR